MNFTVVSAAPSRDLLTLAEAKAALSDTGVTMADAEVSSLITETSDAIAKFCCVQEDGVNPPSLLSETIIQTFRLSLTPRTLILARRPATQIDLVTEGGATVSPSLYELNRPQGLLMKLDAGGNHSTWSGIVVVTYRAGYTFIPEPLKRAAKSIIRDGAYARSNDPNVRQEQIDGVGSIGYFQASGGGTLGMSKEVENLLDDYRHTAVA